MSRHSKCLLQAEIKHLKCFRQSAGWLARTFAQNKVGMLYSFQVKSELARRIDQWFLIRHRLKKPENPRPNLRLKFRIYTNQSFKSPIWNCLRTYQKCNPTRRQEAPRAKAQYQYLAQ